MMNISNKALATIITLPTASKLMMHTANNEQIKSVHQNAVTRLTTVLFYLHMEEHQNVGGLMSPGYSVNF